LSNWTNPHNLISRPVKTTSRTQDLRLKYFAMLFHWYLQARRISPRIMQAPSSYRAIFPGWAPALLYEINFAPGSHVEWLIHSLGRLSVKLWHLLLDMVPDCLRPLGRMPSRTQTSSSSFYPITWHRQSCPGVIFTGRKAQSWLVAHMRSQLSVSNTKVDSAFLCAATSGYFMHRFGVV
jgi:hypothetical protein